MVGIDSGNTLMDTVEETGGSADSSLVSHTHTATVFDPGHQHGGVFQSTGVGVGDRRDFNYASYGGVTSVNVTNISVSNSTEGVSATDTNYQPFITVYMWKRTA
jgi:hypothetical protein